MDIQTLLGDSFKDGMTLDEINAAIADKNFVDSSSLPPSVDKTVFDKTSSDLATAKKALKALQDKTLTDDEKVQAAIDAANSRESDFLVKTNRLEVEKILVKGGLTEDDYKDLIENMVSSDTEKSLTLAQNFVNTLVNQKALVEKNLKAESMRNNPRPPAGDGDNNPLSALDKQIAEAQASGNMPLLAALYRQKSESETKT